MNKKKEIKFKNHENSCRLCLSSFASQESRDELSEITINLFFELTSMNLNSSPKFSRFICEDCTKDLDDYSNLREKLIRKQVELENFVSEKSALIKEEPDEYQIIFKEDIPESYVKTEIYNEDQEDNDFIDEFTDESPKVTSIPKSYRCEWCKRKFTERKSLNNHTLSQHKERLTAMEIRDIRRKKKSDRKLVCPQCGIATHYLNDHIQTQHLNTKRYFCDHCDYKSYRRYEMKIHMCKHRSRPQFYCDLCGTAFARKNAIHVHMNNQHRNEGPLTCCFCLKKCKNRTALWHHRKSYHSDLAGVKQKCSLCDKEILITYMRKHIRQIHGTKSEDDEKQLCIICGKILPNKRSFVFHKRVHKERTFICKHSGCTKKYLTEHQLNEHEKTHLNQREHKCSYLGCDKSYFKQRLLRMHVALFHENFKENCPVPDCRFTVGRRDYMKSHVAKHTELGKDLVASLLEVVKKNPNLW